MIKTLILYLLDLAKKVMSFGPGEKSRGKIADTGKVTEFFETKKVETLSYCVNCFFMTPIMV